MSAKNNSRQKVDIAVLQERVDEIDRNVKLILENHLPHIHNRVDIIEKKIAYYAGGLAVLLVIIKFLFR